MKRILVLGAGLVAKPLVQYLVAVPEFEVTVASRTLAKAERLVGDAPNGRAKTVNVDDREALEALVRDADLAVSLLPYVHHPVVAGFCVKHGKQMVTTSYVKDAMMALDGGRIGIASQALGIGVAAQEESVAYARERQQFNKPISSFQAIQWMLADNETDLEAARQLTLRAAWLKEAGKPFSQEASMAKTWSTEAAGRVCDNAIQVHGGYGYVKEYAVERHYRDVRVTRIYEGTNQVQRIVIARNVMEG